MKISKIFAGMSAAAIIAAAVAMPASAVVPTQKTFTYTITLTGDELKAAMDAKGTKPQVAEEEIADPNGAEGDTMKAYNIGFNIQFGHFCGGTFSATATGGDLLTMGTDENGALTCTGEKTDSQSMWLVNDWAGTVKNQFVENVAIADGGGESSGNPGWNGMWIQCYTADLDAGLEVTVNIDASDATWKDMDPEDPDFTGWSVLVPALDGKDAFIIKDAGGDNSSDSGSTSSGDSSNTSSGSSSGSSSSSSSGSSSSKGGSNGGSNGGSTSKGSATTSSAKDAGTSDNTANAESGAAAGVGLAIAALAGAAIVVSRKK